MTITSVGHFCLAVALGAAIFSTIHSNNVVIQAWLRGALVKVPAFFAHLFAPQGKPAVIVVPAAKAPIVPAAPIVSPTVMTSVPLDPAAAATMTQPEMYNLGFLTYLKSLSKDALLKWQSDFVRAGVAALNEKNPGGGWLWDPFGISVPGSVVNVLPGTTGAMMQVASTAQCNLIILGNLGVPVVNGVPGQ